MITKPDFKQWAKNIKSLPESSIEQSLKDAFEQGYHLGLREGDENTWWKEQDADWVRKTNNLWKL